MKNKKISHFKIVNELGQGGMGVVYKAEDTKLKRTVALKFLPLNAVSTKAEKDRFVREAQAAAALNHSNIATIYAIDEEDGQSFIAMEHIEGDNLKEMISKSPLKLKKAIDIAAQIALGLQAAHDRGVVHRDIKSANIMVTEKGDVKIMDFGLAKLSNSTMLTKEGMTMGTAAYMSPEQTRGEKVDYRTDIWSLGVVLYEMVTGEMPFKGDYEQALIYSILNEEPEPLSALRSRIPMELERIVEKCLAKDPGFRYQNAMEIPVDLKAIDITSTGSSSRVIPAPSSMTTVSPRPEPKKSKFKGFIKRTIVFGALAVIGFFFWYFFVSPPEKSVKRLSINVDAELNYVPNATVAISPDGKNLVYVSKNEGKTQLYLRPMASFESQPIQGTANAHSPFISPDGEWVGFFADGKLSKVSLFGGVPTELADVESSMGASWGPDGEIYFAGVISGNNEKCIVYKVGEDGSKPKAVTLVEQDAAIMHAFPEVIKSGEALLFTSLPTAEYGFDNASIEVLNLETGARNTALEGGIYGRYCETGQLVAVWSEGLFAAPFDINSLKVTGPTKPIDGNVHLNYKLFPNFTFSKDGSLVYASDEKEGNNQKIVQLNRRGEIKELLSWRGAFSQPLISGTGNELIVVSQNAEVGENKILKLNLKDGTVSELVVNGEIGKAIFTKQADVVTYSEYSENKWHLVNHSFKSGKKITLLSDENKLTPDSWAVNGKTLAFSKTESDSNGIDLWLYELGRRKATSKPYLQTKYDERMARFSMRGGLIAYLSNQNGRDEVFVQSFPDTVFFAQVSQFGATCYTWNLAGTELAFIQDGRVCIAKVSDGDVSTVKKLMPLVADESGFTIAAQDNFVTVLSETDYKVSNFKVVLNWFEDVTKEVPSGKKLFNLNFLQEK